MRMKMKYIVFSAMMGVEDIVIFTEMQKHDEMASVMRISKDQVISAGFIRIKKDANPGFDCYGKSDSLGKEYRPGLDSALANRLIGNTDEW